MSIGICMAGATGWTGSALVPAIDAAEDLRLVASVSRSHAGEQLAGAPVYASVGDALDGVDVMIDYTAATAVRANVMAAIEAGVHVVVGSSGLSAADFEEIDAAARELAERLSAVRRPVVGHPIDETIGPAEARGTSVDGTQVHSLRLPSFVVSAEVVFGLPDERLTIRHDAGGSPAPYVAGTLIAARHAPEVVGLIRGLDTLLLESS